MSKLVYLALIQTTYSLFKGIFDSYWLTKHVYSFLLHTINQSILVHPRWRELKSWFNLTTPTVLHIKVCLFGIDTNYSYVGIFKINFKIHNIIKRDYFFRSVHLWRISDNVISRSYCCSLLLLFQLHNNWPKKVIFVF